MLAHDQRFCGWVAESFYGSVRRSKRRDVSVRLACSRRSPTQGGPWAAVGGAGLAGGLPGLGSSMTRGPYAGWQLGQALDLPAMCTSGPLVLLDAGPGPGRWLKPWSRPPQPRRTPSLTASGRLPQRAARAPAGLERGGDRSAGPAGGRAARGERSEPT
jgi:hypothetical protein